MRSRTLDERVDDNARARDVTARRRRQAPCRRAGMDIDALEQAVMLDRSAPRRPDHAHAVGIVDHDKRIVRFREPHDVRQGCQIAFMENTPSVTMIFPGLSACLSSTRARSAMSACGRCPRTASFAMARQPSMMLA